MAAAARFWRRVMAVDGGDEARRFARKRPYEKMWCNM